MALHDSKNIVLGSGRFYIAPVDTDTTGGTGTAAGFPADFPIPSTSGQEDKYFFTWIKGGATLSYSQETYEAKDDLEKVSKIIQTSEDVVLKTGLMTFDPDTLNHLISTGAVSTDSSTGTKTWKIGGSKNSGEYCVAFVQTSEESDNTTTTRVVKGIGVNQSNFDLAFAKDQESIVNAEFKLTPLKDSSGVKCLYEESNS